MSFEVCADRFERLEFRHATRGWGRASVVVENRGPRTLGDGILTIQAGRPSGWSQGDGTYRVAIRDLRPGERRTLPVQGELGLIEYRSGAGDNPGQDMGATAHVWWDRVRFVGGGRVFVDRRPPQADSGIGDCPGAHRPARE